MDFKMLHPWLDLPTGKSPPDIVTAIVEIPSGSRNKYEISKESGWKYCHGQVPATRDA
jgi:inorganic pyrophosphatase